jgi:hypothetical protein
MTKAWAWERSGTNSPSGCKKNYGRWLFDGGAGYQVVPQTNYRDFPNTGWLVKRELNERLELGAEVFAHGREGYAAAQTQRSTMIDVGGYYHFKHHPGEQFLFCYGQSIAGQTENYAYAGMYWNWGGKGDKGKDDRKDTAANNWMQGPMRGNGIRFPSKTVSKVYKPMGTLSGVTTVAIVVWFLAWGFLEWRWGKRAVGMSRIQPGISCVVGPQHSCSPFLPSLIFYRAFA